MLFVIAAYIFIVNLFPLSPAVPLLFGLVDPSSLLIAAHFCN